MKQFAAVLGLFAVLLPSASCGQEKKQVAPTQSGGEGEPSAAALELARVLAPSSFIMVRRITEEEASAELSRQLLGEQPATKGPSCDPRHEACVATARQVATRHAADYARLRNDFADQIYARVFQAKMSPAEIAAALAFARTAGGRTLAAALRFPNEKGDQSS